MKRGLVVAAALLLAATALAVPPSTDSYLLSVGHAPGKCVSVPGGGQVCSLWRSDAWVYNPSTTTVANVSIYFLERKVNTSPEVRQIQVNPGETRSFPEIVGQLFGKTSSFGGLRFVSDIPVVVTGRVYDANVVGNTGVSGTAGQFFAGMPASVAIGVGDQSSVVGMAQDTVWRSNLFLVEVTGSSATVEVARVDSNGVVQATTTTSVGAREVKQLNEIIKTLGSTSATNQRIRVTVTGGSGKVLTGGSVVDNRTADPSTIEMVTKAVGNTTGRFDGVVFTSDGLFIDGGIELTVSNAGLTSWAGLAGMECPLIGVVVDFSNTPITPITIAADGTFSDQVEIAYSDDLGTVFTTTWTLAGTVSPTGVISGTLQSATTGGAGDYSSCNITVTRNWRAGWTGQ